MRWKPISGGYIKGWGTKFQTLVGCHGRVGNTIAWGVRGSKFESFLLFLKKWAGTDVELPYNDRQQYRSLSMRVNHKNAFITKFLWNDPTHCAYNIGLYHCCWEIEPWVAKKHIIYTSSLETNQAFCHFTLSKCGANPTTLFMP